MTYRRLLIFVVLCLCIPLTSAQSDDLLAFLNGSGQLVVSSGDGSTRWIATNPGQVIDEAYGFGWTDSGTLVFALDGFGALEGDPTSQAIQPFELNIADRTAYLRGVRTRPNIAQPDGLSTDGAYGFVWGDGRYFTVPVGTTAGFRLRLVGDNDAQGSGLWSDVAPLVAYWGFNNDVGGTALAVWNPATETDMVVNSGSTIPVPPVAWQANTTNLIFRTGSGDVRLADVGCLVSGCSDNPLENGILLAPSSANHIQVTADRAYYVDNQQVYGVDLTCVDSDNCLDSRFVVGQNAVPLSMMHISNNRLVYTSFTSDPNNAIDRTVQVVDLTCTPDCAPQAILQGAMSGLVSPSGDFVMVDVVGEGLNILNISGGGLVYLTETMGGQLGAGLTTARWR